jgi:hypothetical protein
MDEKKTTIGIVGCWRYDDQKDFNRIIEEVLQKENIGDNYFLNVNLFTLNVRRFVAGKNIQYKSFRDNYDTHYQSRTISTDRAIMYNSDILIILCRKDSYMAKLDIKSARQIQKKKPLKVHIYQLCSSETNPSHSIIIDQ